MKLSQDAIIAQAKLNRYLLVSRSVDDKSKFLAQAGYKLENWIELEADLRNQILPLEAAPSLEQNLFGEIYKIRANLVGPNGLSLEIVTVWMVEFETGLTKFITLYPDRRD